MIDQHGFGASFNVAGINQVADGGLVSAGQALPIWSTWIALVRSMGRANGRSHWPVGTGSAAGHRNLAARAHETISTSKIAICVSVSHKLAAHLGGGGGGGVTKAAPSSTVLAIERCRLTWRRVIVCCPLLDR